jgi:voltage-gated sodium channel
MLILLNERFILSLILLNAAVIFILGFSPTYPYNQILEVTDYLFTVVFLLEIIYKIKTHGAFNFFHDPWNSFDAILVALALPPLILWASNTNVSQLDFLVIFRVMRILKFIRFIRFIPNIKHIFTGVSRAAKASVLLLFVFFILNFTLSMLACFLFRELSPEHFGNPLKAFYSMFKVFTVEGWFEIPDTLADQASPSNAFFIRLFFIIVFFFGGVFGLSIVNSIFVDTMVSDNNDALEQKINVLEQKIDRLLEQQQSANDSPS